MKKAAGVLLHDSEGRVLLLRRSKKATDASGTWAFPGGHVEEGETAEDAAKRELQEETGFDPSELVLVPHSRRQKDGVDFETFIGRTGEAFSPTLNDEHDGHRWLQPDVAKELSTLHPGARVAFDRMGMNETQVAKAMACDDLVSPQEFANSLLVNVRITGTGASYRPAVDEFVWRDPSLYMNDEFLERCMGLPVIWEHPDGGQPLDSEQYAKRNVGAIMHAYLKGEDEVWGIARILDDDAKRILKTETVSTSPCVVFQPESAGKMFRTDDGTPLLVEGKPWLLDHLAICEAGVWDKGGAPSGVANDVKADSASTTTEETDMAEKPADKPVDKKTEVKADEKKADAAPVTRSDDGGEMVMSKEGEKLDKVLKHLDSLHSRLDEFDGMHKAFKARFDAAFPEERREEAPPAEHQEAAPPAKHEHEGEETRETANLQKEAEPTPLAADGEMQPGKESEHGALAAEREGNHLKVNDSRADALARIERLEKRTAEMPEETRAKFVAAQAAAERVYQAFSDSAGAPRWLNGETLEQYQGRLAGKYKAHSKWKDLDLSTVPAHMLPQVCDQIYSDAITFAGTPESVGPGALRTSVTVDETGRRIRRFHGDPEVAWAPFKQPVRRISGFKTKFN